MRIQVDEIIALAANKVERRIGLSTGNAHKPGQLEEGLERGIVVWMERVDAQA